MAVNTGGNMAASMGSPKSNETKESPSQSQRELIITPSIVELTKEVRTNILCTVEGCGKILPNTPALNMHLVKSHRVKVVIMSVVDLLFTPSLNCKSSITSYTQGYVVVAYLNYTTQHYMSSWDLSIQKHQFRMSINPPFK